MFQYSKNDIALYKSDVNFGQKSTFMPICLPGQNFAFKSGAATVGGWGKKTDENTHNYQSATEYGIAGDIQKCTTSGCESIKMNGISSSKIKKLQHPILRETKCLPLFIILTTFYIF